MARYNGVILNQIKIGNRVSSRLGISISIEETGERIKNIRSGLFSIQKNLAFKQVVQKSAITLKTNNDGQKLLRVNDGVNDVNISTVLKSPGEKNTLLLKTQYYGDILPQVLSGSYNTVLTALTDKIITGKNTSVMPFGYNGIKTTTNDGDIIDSSVTSKTIILKNSVLHQFNNIGVKDTVFYGNELSSRIVDKIFTPKSGITHGFINTGIQTTYRHGYDIQEYPVMKQIVNKASIIHGFTNEGDKTTLLPGYDTQQYTVIKQSIPKDIKIYEFINPGDKTTSWIGNEMNEHVVSKQLELKNVTMHEYINTGDKTTVLSGNEMNEHVVSKQFELKNVTTHEYINTGDKTTSWLGDGINEYIVSKQYDAKNVILAYNNTGNKTTSWPGDEINEYLVSKQYDTKNAVLAYNNTGDKTSVFDGNALILPIVAKEFVLKPITFLSNYVQGTKTKENDGYVIDVDMVSKQEIAKAAVAIMSIVDGDKTSQFDGKYINTMEMDTNAINKYMLTVTPTHPYGSQKVIVTATSTEKLIGQWNFVINGIEHIPYSSIQDLSNISIELDVSALITGNNNCKILLKYDDGSVYFLPLVITKEEYKSRTIKRTFATYDGGYVYSDILPVATARLIHGIPGVVAYYNESGTIKSSDITSIDLRKYSGISSIAVTGSGCKILFSFDNETWLAYDGTNWNSVSENDIAVNGMSINTVNSLTPTQLSKVFIPAKMNFMIYIDGALGTVYEDGNSISYITDIIFTLPSNIAPVINVNINPTTLHAGAAKLVGTIADSDNDLIQYHISINNSEIIPWTTSDSSVINLDLDITQEIAPVGINEVKIEATDGYLSSTPYNNLIIRTNENPRIVGTLSGLDLACTIGDLNNDKIRYRISLNNNVKSDWSEFISSPIDVSYTLDQLDIIYNKTNTLLIEAEDELLGIGQCSIEFIGQYYKTRKGFVFII